MPSKKGFKTQSPAGLWNRNSNFGLHRQAHKCFGSGSNFKVIGSDSRTIWPIQNSKPFYYLYNSLAQQTVEWEPKFQAPAPAIPNCLGSGSTALVTSAIKCQLTINARFYTGLWSESPNSFGWLETELSPKLLDGGAGVEFRFHRHSLWDKRVVQVIELFSHQWTKSFQSRSQNL